MAAGLCKLGNRRRAALPQSVFSCANLRGAVRVSLSELSSGVSASPPSASRSRLSCLLPKTQRRRLRSAISVTAPELPLACHVERSRLQSRSFMRRSGDISCYFRLQSDQKYLEILRLRSE